MLGTWLMWGDICAGWLYLLFDPDMMNSEMCPLAHTCQRRTTKISHPINPIKLTGIGLFSRASRGPPPAERSDAAGSVVEVICTEFVRPMG
jgi:hypothetical protein